MNRKEANMRRKKNKNKKIDIYTALMLPLMTMFLLNIGLVATTWAWYTASVSSGVNEIKAVATESTVNIYPKPSSNDLTNVAALSNNESVQKGTNGLYTLESGITYIVELINNGSSASGYHCVFTVMDANGIEIGQFYTSNFQSSFKFSISQQVGKGVKIKVKTLWGSHNGEKNLVENEDSKVLTYLDNGLKIETPESYALRNAKKYGDIPKFSYSIKFYDQNTNQEIKTSISNETEQEVIELNDYLVDGYELVESEDYEIVDGVMYLFIDPEIDSNIFNIYYTQSTTSQGTGTDPSILAKSKQNEGNETPEETPPVQETDPSTSQSETETNPTPATEEAVVEDGGGEAGETGEEEIPTEEKKEVDGNAQSETGD